MTEQTTKPNIYQRLNAVRNKVKYIKKDQEVQGYKAVTHDNVTAMTRDALIEHGVMVIPAIFPGDCVERKYKSGTEYIQLRTMIEVSFVNVDDPEDRFTVPIEAHADDSGDKAPGKALSYGVKNAILKVLYLETGESDESRNMEYTEQQKQTFDSIVAAEDAIGIRLIQLITDPEAYSALCGSFKRGSIGKMKAKVEDLENQGTQILISIDESISTGDFTLAAESVDGISIVGKALLRKYLGREGIDNLNKLLREAQAEEI